MILNDHQYGITKTKVKEFAQAIAKLSDSPKATGIDKQIRHKAYLDTLNSQLEEFQAEISFYKSKLQL
ncbi:MAG: hypothetical protein AAFR77_16465 [Cyanobacteria bacterium J06631_2]